MLTNQPVALRASGAAMYPRALIFKSIVMLSNVKLLVDLVEIFGEDQFYDVCVRTHNKIALQGDQSSRSVVSIIRAIEGKLNVVEYEMNVEPSNGFIIIEFKVDQTRVTINLG